MAEDKKRIHHCFNCGEETEDYDELPNGKRIYICSSQKCAREFIEECRAMEAEARDRADNDGYSQYY